MSLGEPFVSSRYHLRLQPSICVSSFYEVRRNRSPDNRLTTACLPPPPRNRRLVALLRLGCCFFCCCWGDCRWFVEAAGLAVLTICFSKHHKLGKKIYLRSPHQVVKVTQFAIMGLKPATYSLTLFSFSHYTPVSLVSKAYSLPWYFF